jgi:two-component system cell cycle response regulator
MARAKGPDVTARVLVVDDIPSNVLLLKAQLSAHYFEVATACDGYEALRLIESDPPDIVLLDIMMPGISGYEVCRRVRHMPGATASIPIVMVTALDRPTDRLEGLEAGADDFLSKPLNEAVLLARVRSLVRLKQMTDELVQRQTTARSMGLPDPVRCLVDADPSGRILIVDDREDTLAPLAETLGPKHKLIFADNAEDALARAGGDDDLDLAMVSLAMAKTDGLRLCSRIRSTAKGRHLPILVIVREDDPNLVAAFEVGVNDCITRPIDGNELLARVKWLLRKKRYADQLSDSLALSLSLATTDELTGFFNRHFMDRHLDLLIEKSNAGGQGLALMVFDIDHFKRVNDEHGHDIGDEVLRGLASRLSAVVRNSDLICRYGGEEFVVLMRNTDMKLALMIAERIRALLEATPIPISRAPGALPITVSVGVAVASGNADSAEALFHRADKALYRAKKLGRNRVCEDAVEA